MILNILIFKNVELECFTTPVFDDHNAEDAAVQLARGIKQAVKKGENKFDAYKGLEMYYIGTFNDVTGELVAIPAKLLLKCDECFKGVENGK